MNTVKEAVPLSKEGNPAGPGPLGSLEGLDIHLQTIIASGALAKIRDIQHARRADSSVSQGTPKMQSGVTVQVDDMDAGMQSAAAVAASHPHV